MLFRVCICFSLLFCFFSQDTHSHTEKQRREERVSERGRSEYECSRIRVRVRMYVCDWANHQQNLKNLLSMCIPILFHSHTLFHRSSVRMLVHSMLLVVLVLLLLLLLHSHPKFTRVCLSLCVCMWIIYLTMALFHSQRLRSSTTYAAYATTTASSSSPFSSFSFIIMIFYFYYPCLFLLKRMNQRPSVLHQLKAFQSLIAFAWHIHTHTHKYSEKEWQRESKRMPEIHTHIHAQGKSKRHIGIARAHISPLIYHFAGDTRHISRIC